ncbi:Ham1-like protein [Cantharellus anzutake]|uniref:Ham1-like protein n=1 Tax=Cantharellus anzutake TaxID=1750568 RepID=UPI00190627E2|nr:Ham1-like protein [Cantharellus anzutake]KAF8339996.1 Ham1-like protein [Cantharellus anzutake]
MAQKIIVFVTGNANKLREFNQILGAGEEAPFRVEGRRLDLPEVQGTTQEVSREKCKRATELVGGPVIVEDTALCYDALGGLPGPYIKWFMKTLGHDGLNTLLDGFPTRTAHALCTFAYSPGLNRDDPEAEPEIHIFEGRTEGTIVPPRGPANFGWDPVFEVKGVGQTYAEMDPVEKNKISHRYKAIQALREYLLEHPPQ